MANAGRRQRGGSKRLSGRRKRRSGAGVGARKAEGPSPRRWLELAGREIAGMMGQPVVIVRPEGTILSCNRAFGRLIGLLPGRLAGQPLGKFVRGGRRATLGGLLRAARRGRAKGEFSLSAGDGTARAVEIQARALGEAPVEAICMVITDLAERQAAARAVRRSRELYRLTVAAAHEGVCMLDKRGVATYVSGRLAQMLRWPAGKLVGRALADLADGDWRAQARRRLASALAGGEERFECLFRRSDGKGLWALVSAKGMPQGRAREWAVAMLEDVTERYRQSREILVAVQRERERISQDLHDTLGQNLTGIALLSKALEDKLSRRSLGESEDAAKISSLANESNALSRVLVRGLCPLVERAGGLVEALEELAERAWLMFKVRCSFACQKSIPRQDLSVARHVYHIAVEAVNNAVRHGKARSVSIRLFKRGRRLALRVIDDGMGVRARRGAMRGLGAWIMNNRARTIDGVLKMTAGRKGGTVVTCVFPGRRERRGAVMEPARRELVARPAWLERR